MVLYTPYDIGTIMEDPSQPTQGYREVSLENGVTLVGTEVQSGFQIERVISGNANVFLLPEYQPGTVIKLT